MFNTLLYSGIALIILGAILYFVSCYMVKYYEKKEKEYAISTLQRAKTFLQEGAKMLEDSNLYMNPRYVSYRASW